MSLGSLFGMKKPTPTAVALPTPATVASPEVGAASANARSIGAAGGINSTIIGGTGDKGTPTTRNKSLIGA